jgi:hypothetical protein
MATSSLALAGSQSADKFTAVRGTPLLRRRSLFGLALGALVRGATALVLVIGCAYAAWPVVTALQLKRAITISDTFLLERKIEWDTVRSTLRNSLHAEFLGSGPNAAQPVHRGFWHRVKVSIGEHAIDKFIDAYMTPDGLPALAGYSRAYRDKVQRPIGSARGKFGITTGVARESLGIGAGELGPEPEPLPFFSRIRSAMFTGLDRFEIEMVHPSHPGKRIVSVLELRTDDWKLTQVFFKPESGP